MDFPFFSFGGIADEETLPPILEPCQIANATNMPIPVGVWPSHKGFESTVRVTLLGPNVRNLLNLLHLQSLTLAGVRVKGKCTRTPALMIERSNVGETLMLESSIKRSPPRRAGSNDITGTCVCSSGDRTDPTLPGHDRQCRSGRMRRFSRHKAGRQARLRCPEMSRDGRPS